MQPTKQPAESIKKPQQSLSKTSVVVLTVLNTIFLGGALFLASRMGGMGEEIKQLRTKQLAQEQVSTTVTQEELARYKQQYDTVLGFFPDENEMISFVTQIDNLRKAGTITGFSFASDSPLKDKNGILGLPILIEARGNLAQINAAVEAVQKLPVIINGVRTEVAKAEEETLTLRWGGFLYVDQNYNQN